MHLLPKLMRALIKTRVMTTRTMRMMIMRILMRSRAATEEMGSEIRMPAVSPNWRPLDYAQRLLVTMIGCTEDLS